MRFTSIKDKFLNWGEKTTIHALPIVFESRHIIVKIIAFIFFGLSFGICCNVLYSNLLTFLAYNVDTVLIVTRETNTTFPAISVCVIQVCDLKGYTYQPYFNMTWTQMSAQLNMISAIGSTGNNTISAFTDLTRQNFITYYNKSLLLKATGNAMPPAGKLNYSIADYLISCQYGSSNCYESDWVFFQVNEFQKCWRFNSGKDKNGNSVPLLPAQRFGAHYGLQLELFTNLSDTCKSPLNHMNGVFLYIHNSTYNVSEDSPSIQLSPGFETSVAIDRTFIQRLPTPYSDCVVNNDASYSSVNDYVAYTFKISANYSQVTCLQICYQKFVQNTYGCTDQFLPFVVSDLTTYPYCNLTIDNYNNSDIYEKKTFYAQNGDNKCTDNCPTECQYFNYKSTVSATTFPTATYQDALAYKPNVYKYFGGDLAKIRNGTLRTNVFYNTDMYNFIYDKPSVDFDSWLSDTGGTMGLFLGASLLSLMEFVDLFVEILLILCEHKKKVGASQTSLMKTGPPVNIK